MDLTSNNSNDLIKVTKYRWIIISLFCLYGAINFIQFLQYTIISNIIVKYYEVESVLVDLSGLIFMITTIVFCAPANYLIRKFDLRIIAILGSGLTTVGNLLKLASIAPDRYYVVLLSQFICSLGQVLIMSEPTKLASVWFGREQVSTACAIAILGTQSGIAIGLLLPSHFITDTSTKETITDGMWTMNITNASVTVAIFLLVIFFFKAKPKYPPSLSQLNLVENDETSSLLVDLKALLSNKNFLLIALIFGISNGIYSFMGIVVNDIYLHYFPDSEQDVGIISCISAFAGGCVGSVIFGYILDRWHKFKLTSFVVIFVPAIVFIFLVYVMEEKIRLATFFIFPLFGFFLASTLVIGFEFGTEVTHPLPEVTSCSVLNATIYMFSIIFTLSIGNLFDTWGYINVDIIVFSLLIISSGLLYFVEPKLKRLEANNLQQQSQDTPNNSRLSVDRGSTSCIIP